MTRLELEGKCKIETSNPMLFLLTDSKPIVNPESETSAALFDQLPS